MNSIVHLSVRSHKSEPFDLQADTTRGTPVERSVSGLRQKARLFRVADINLFQAFIDTLFLYIMHFMIALWLYIRVRNYRLSACPGRSKNGVR